MDFGIGSRVNVPGSDAQGVVTNRSTTSTASVLGLMPSEYVAVRYIAANGATVDQTYPMKAIIEANPVPVDVVALQRKLDAALADNMTLRERLVAKTQRQAARKAKSRKR